MEIITTILFGNSALGIICSMSLVVLDKLLGKFHIGYTDII